MTLFTFSSFFNDSLAVVVGCEVVTGVLAVDTMWNTGKAVAANVAGKEAEAEFAASRAVVSGTSSILTGVTAETIDYFENDAVGVHENIDME